MDHEEVFLWSLLVARQDLLENLHVELLRLGLRWVDQHVDVILLDSELEEELFHFFTILRRLRDITHCLAWFACLLVIDPHGVECCLREQDRNNMIWCEVSLLKLLLLCQRF